MGSSHILEDIQKFYGKLLHTSSLIPAGWAYLTGFEWMLAICNTKPFLPQHPDKAIATDLDWWHHVLTSGEASRPITPPPLYTDPSAFSDASSGISIGVTVSYL